MLKTPHISNVCAKTHPIRVRSTVIHSLAQNKPYACDISGVKSEIWGAVERRGCALWGAVSLQNVARLNDGSTSPSVVEAGFQFCVTNMADRKPNPYIVKWILSTWYLNSPPFGRVIKMLHIVNLWSMPHALNTMIDTCEDLTFDIWNILGNSSLKIMTFL